MVAETIRELGDHSLEPGPTRAEYEERSRENLRLLGEAICAKGYKVIVGSEAIFVLAEDGLWEEFHAVHFERGQFIPGGKYIGVHFAGPVPTPTPTPTPEPDFGCPEPRPARVWTRETLPPGWGDNEIGRPRWQINSKQHGVWIDTTAVVIRNEPHCRAIGLSPYADGQPRQACPVRPDGHPDRTACERYIAEGDWVVVAEGGAVCEANPSNSAQFRRTSAGGKCKLCNPTKTSCSASY